MIEASGLSLDLNRCELLPVNNYIITWVCNIPVRHCVTYLGVHITKGRKSRGTPHFTPIIENSQKVLNHWLQRDQTLKGSAHLGGGTSRPICAFSPHPFWCLWKISLKKTTTNTYKHILVWKQWIIYYMPHFTKQRWQNSTLQSERFVHLHDHGRKTVRAAQ